MQWSMEWIYRKKPLQKRKKTRRRKTFQTEFVLSDGELMNKTWEKKFDWIVIVDVLHDLPNPDPCLAEVKRVLKDDGAVSTIIPIKK